MAQVEGYNIQNPLDLERAPIVGSVSIPQVPHQHGNRQLEGKGEHIKKQSLDTKQTQNYRKKHKRKQKGKERDIDDDKVSSGSLMDMLIGKGFSRGVYLQTGGGLDGHTPRAVGLDFFDRLSRLERIKNSRLEAGGKMSSKKGKKERPHKLLSIPSVGYARIAMGPNIERSKTVTGVGDKETKEQHGSKTAGKGDLLKGVPFSESGNLPTIDFRDAGYKATTKSLQMEEVIRALEYHNSQLERAKRHSDARVSDIDTNAYGDSVPPPAAEVALRTSRKNRLTEKPPPLVNSGTFVVNNDNQVGKCENTQEDLTPRSSPFEQVLKQNSVTYKRKQKPDSRGKLQSLLIAHKVSREEDTAERQKVHRDIVFRRMVKNKLLASRKLPDVPNVLTPSVTLPERSTVSLKDSKTMEISKTETKKPDFVRRVTIVLPSQFENVD